METLELSVQSRSATGKSEARAMRREGVVPGIVYGPKMEAAPISLNARDFDRKVGYGTHTQLLRLQSEDSAIAEKLVLVKDLQRHPVTRDLVHADFYEVDVNEKITVEVGLNFVGKAAGVDIGGILQPVRRRVEVLCLPLQIPDEIDVDVSALGIHDAIHISEINAPEGVEIPFDADVTIVTVLPPVVDETKAAAAEEGEGEGEGAGEGATEEKKEEEPAEG